MNPVQIRYTPQAMDDLLAVWDGVYEASKEASVADKYVADFVASISQKRDFPLSGIPLHYRGLFTGFFSVNFKKYKAKAKEYYQKALDDCDTGLSLNPDEEVRKALEAKKRLCEERLNDLQA